MLFPEAPHAATPAGVSVTDGRQASFACTAARRAAYIIFRTPKIYTTTGFGPRKNSEMVNVDDLVVYMQTLVEYYTFYIHHPKVRSASGVV